jgi:hypothetical protein
MSRRRSRQSKGRSRWSRRIGGGLVVVLVLGVIGMLGAYFWIRNYLRSEEFLTMVNGRASEALHAEARFEPFLWEGWHVRSPRLEVTGEGLIRRLEAEDFETEVSMESLLLRRFESSEFLGRSVHIELDLTKPALNLPEQSEAFEFPGMKISSVSGSMDFTKSSYSWTGVGADIRSGSARGSFDVKLAGGSVRTPVSLFPEGKLNNLRARYFGRRVYVTEADFGVFESGRLNLSGEIGLGEGQYALAGELRRALCEEMVPENWKKKMLGTLESDFTVSGSSKKAPIVRGDLVVKQGVLTALPVLDRLAAYTDTRRFRRLVLSEASLNYTQQGGRLELSEIVLASEGLTRVEGRMTIVDGRLDGHFNFGVMPGVMAGIPGAETKVFAPGKEGLLWTPVRVTGTLDNPKEDLSKRMIAAAGERMFEMIPETGLLVLKHGGRKAGEMAKEILKSVGAEGVDPGKVIEQGGNILRGGTGIVRDGVGGLFDLVPGGRRVIPESVPEPETDEEKDKVPDEDKEPEEDKEREEE